MDPVTKLILQGMAYYSVWYDVETERWHVARIHGEMVYGFCGRNKGVWAKDFKGAAYLTKLAAARALATQLKTEAKNKED